MAKTSEIILSEHSPSVDQALPEFMAPDMVMMALTYVTFFVLLGVLYKFAWKPILTALDHRENSIRKSIEDVEQVKKEMEQLDVKCAKIVSDAEERAAGILEQSRKAAKDAAQIIEHKAREEAKITLENTLRDIKEEAQKAQMKLREESAQIAVELASKLIKENLDTEKSQKLVTEFIEEM